MDVTDTAVDIDRAVLIVVDVQNGFTNHHSRHVVPVISGVAERWSAASRPVVFTRYRNYPGSSFERFFRWSRLQDSPETDIVPELADQAASAYAVLDKVGYSLFTDEAITLLADAGWTDLVFCGIATESCVLKSAADAFERGYAPWVLTDASASDAGPAVHDAGLTVARRLIGPRQLITTENLLAQLAPRLEVPVLE
ncbi:cysteine hydrolase family protein [Actinacidiphila paucisporea]|uniref:Nicotinamidase-related amidase n=1 Tax=Actinacidiphila paucisporea TaxID=310782 RepID=A0A1M6YYT7_9ACTN|nr:isochorismatase family cysteine hydrolase [Actinacidiphila paucisporea]SHL23252.1 Nicotinamidase-related amidase [Actinacidiphila paucisporea]